MDTNDLRTVEFVTSLGNSDGKPIAGTERKHILLFNSKYINDAEIEAVINDGSWEFDQRFVEVSEKQLEYLKGNIEVR